MIHLATCVTNAWDTVLHRETTSIISLLGWCPWPNMVLCKTVVVMLLSTNVVTCVESRIGDGGFQNHASVVDVIVAGRLGQDQICVSDGGDFEFISIQLPHVFWPVGGWGGQRRHEEMRKRTHYAKVEC